MARNGVLLDIVAGRDSAGPAQWLIDRPGEWKAPVQWDVMDLSRPLDQRKSARWVPSRRGFNLGQQPTVDCSIASAAVDDSGSLEVPFRDLRRHLERRH